MSAWPEFNNNGTVYDLSHLHPKTMEITREATDSHPSKDVRIFLSYSDHCFTDHHGEDDSWIYTNAQGYKTRYFCRERYRYSFEIDNILQRVFRDNVYIKRTMNEKKEQFFYLDVNTLFCDFRLFLEIEKHHKQDHDIWMKVVSAHPEKPYANPVGGDYFKVWRVMDARQSNIELPPRKNGRRGRGRGR